MSCRAAMASSERQENSPSEPKNATRNTIRSGEVERFEPTPGGVEPPHGQDVVVPTTEKGVHETRHGAPPHARRLEETSAPGHFTERGAMIASQWHPVVLRDECFLVRPAQHEVRHHAARRVEQDAFPLAVTDLVRRRQPKAKLNDPVI